jgi:hypothetical protein
MKHDSLILLEFCYYICRHLVVLNFHWLSQAQQALGQPIKDQRNYKTEMEIMTS